MIWIERYRPKKLEDVVLSDENRELFQSFIDKKEIPHLMFVGSAGTGKTTVAKILLREIEAETLEINASDDRGIGVVRGKIKCFMSTELLVGKRLKAVFLDEADSTTEEFQTAMRRILEDYAELSRVIFSLNYRNKIIDPIVSRCQVIEFKPLPLVDVAKLFAKILTKEGVKFESEALYQLADDCKGDLRKGIGTLQKDSTTGTFKYSGAIFEGVSVEELINYIKKQNWQGLYNAIQNVGNLEEVYRELFDKYWLVNERCVAIVSEYMYRHSIVFDPILNLLCCFRELAKYDV